MLFEMATVTMLKVLPDSVQVPVRPAQIAKQIETGIDFSGSI